jgi:hypothetical protein
MNLDRVGLRLLRLMRRERPCCRFFVRLRRERLLLLRLRLRLLRGRLGFEPRLCLLRRERLLLLRLRLRLLLRLCFRQPLHIGFELRRFW